MAGTFYVYLEVLDISDIFLEKFIDEKSSLKQFNNAQKSFKEIWELDKKAF